MSETPSFIHHFPGPLLEDLVNDRWLPIIGAGFSRNAVLPPGMTMPLWRELSDELAKDMEGHTYQNPLDAMSEYEQRFSRARLIEKLHGLLLVDRARPGSTHRAFCDLNFGTVCTTNFDLLLDQGYRQIARPVRHIVQEDQLSVRPAGTNLDLVKLHGDIAHPANLVITEEDYDRFIVKNPLLVTYFANLLISHTPVLIGYSLDDFDLRQIWRIIHDRLGSLRRPAYAILVGADGLTTAKYERRHVHVINLPASRGGYASVLETCFRELGQFWNQAPPTEGQVVDEEALRELSRPVDAPTRLCYCSVPLPLQSYYRQRLFPIAERAGLVPVTGQELAGAPINPAAKAAKLIERSRCAVIDASTASTLFELGIAVRRHPEGGILAVVEEGQPLPPTLSAVVDEGQHLAASRSAVETVQRPQRPFEEGDAFLIAVEVWFDQVGTITDTVLMREPERLLERREFASAVVAAMSLLERSLATALDRSPRDPVQRKGLRGLIQEAELRNLIRPDEASKLTQFSRVRNEVVHGGSPVAAAQARTIVRDVRAIVDRLEF